MKNKKLPSIIALSICLELVMAPVPALAQNTNSGQSKTQVIMNAVNFGTDFYNNIRGAQAPQAMPAYVATDMAAFKNQITPAADKYFTLQNMQRIPGLMEYIAKKNQDAALTGGKQINPLALNCQTLPTTLHESDTEVCRNRKVNGLAGDPRMQADEAFAYYNQYEQIDKAYQNYSVKSNVGGQVYGVGCMEDAMDVLNGFFAYRLEQMDTMVAEMEKATANFVEQSEMDLKAIRESTAILNGEGSRFATEFKGTDIFNYGKRFNNPACNSIIANNDMDKFGKENGGLSAIEKKLKGDFSATAAGSKYSPESYIKNHADVVNDIKKMADKVSEQVNLNFSSIANDNAAYGQFLDGLNGSVSSESGAHSGLNRSFFGDIQTKFGKSRKKLDDQTRMLDSELGGKGNKVLNLLSNVDSDEAFDAEIGSLQNDIKNECINKSGIDTALARLYDPTLSKQANKHTSSQMSKRIRAIMEDPKISPEKKLVELQALENSSGGRFEMKMDADYEVQILDQDNKLVKKTVNAAGKVTPGGFFSDVIKNCESQFQVNKLNNKYSAKEAIKILRSIKKDYQKVAEQHSKDIKDEIVKKMVECNGNAAAQSSTVEASCSPEKLNMANPGFCAKAAFSCSKNMQQCTEKASKFVKEIKDDRLKRTTNYNNNVEANRKQLVGMFDRTLVKYMKEAESLRGMFGAGFEAPNRIVRDIKDGTQFDTAFSNEKGDPLEIKDPKQYLEMVKANMMNLRGKVLEQQKGIVGSDSILQKHIAQTKENYQQQILSKTKKMANDCLEAYNSYGKMVQDQTMASDKTQGEMGEKNGELCSIYTSVMSKNPDSACDTFENVGKDALKASRKAGGNAAEIEMAIEQMSEKCAGRIKDGDSALKICTSGPPTEFKNYFNIKFKELNQKKVDVDYWTMACAVATSGDDPNLICKQEVTEVTETVAKVNANDTKAKEEAETEKEGKDGKSGCKATVSKKVEASKNGTITEYNFDFLVKCKQTKSKCDKIEDQIKLIYAQGMLDGKLASNSQANSMPSICPSSNNTGQFNPKDMLDVFKKKDKPAETAGTKKE